MNKSEKKSKIPEAPVVAGSSSGNLLSSVPPPSQLPNFVTTSIPTSTNVSLVPQVQTDSVSTQQSTVELVPASQPLPIFQNPEPQSPEKFSPAIPLSKGEPLICIRSPDDSQATQSPESLPESTPELDKLGDVMPGSGIFTWVKGAVSSGGILHRVAEKAKSSVDSMITTLDPQMKEYLNSGGDIYLVVASDKENKISPIREAFQAVFGKATVIGYPAQSEVTAVQPVGCAAAYAAAKQRIAELRSLRPDINNNVPIIAVEGFLCEAIADRWCELSLLVLSQPSLGIELQVQSQGTPVASAAVATAQSATAPDYPHSQTGYSVTIGSIMAASLQVPHTQWQEEVTGVSRRELILLAARSIAGLYKKLLAVSAAQV